MKHLHLIAAVLCAVFATSCGKKAIEPQILTLENNSGMKVKITNYGGRVMSIIVPDKDGIARDVVLGFDTVEEYYPENNQTDFGAAIGRYANRIKDGKFSIDGKEYDLPKNNFGHCLHGGPNGWQYKFYEVVEADKSHVKLRMDSPNGDSGFPGAVTAFVTYTLSNSNMLDIFYEATSDAPTIINMTNHSYFNLSGDPAKHSICDDVLFVNASSYTPVDSTYMTTGEILPTENTPMHFKIPKRIGQDIDRIDFEQIKNGNGYDHNWVLDTKCDPVQVAAVLYCEQTGIDMMVYTTEPGIQVYTGNFLDGSVTGKGAVVYNKRSAICLETQHYPDSPNKSQWPSVELRPGQKYESRCTFAFDSKGLKK